MHGRQNQRKLIQRIGRQRLLAVIFGGLVLPTLAQGATYYVSKSGNDSNSCATATSSTDSNAKFTIAGGIACMAGGDTLIIGDGTYPERIYNTVPSGRDGVPTTIQARNANKVTLNPTAPDYVVWVRSKSYITFDGLDVDGTNAGSYLFFSDATSTYITFQNGTARNGANVYGSGIVLGRAGDTPAGFAMHAHVLNMNSYNNGVNGPAQDPGSHGIYINSASNVVEGNRVYNNVQYGIQIYSSNGGSDNNIVRNNLIYGNKNGAIIKGNANQWYNNVMYGNIQNGLMLYGSPTNTSVFNNTIYNNGYYCISIDGGSDATIQNNICNQNSYGAILDAGTRTICSYNLGVSGGEGPSNKCSSVVSTTNPKFTNAASSDFSLQPTSPAVDTGMTIGSVTNSFGGVPRPQGAAYDIGAYEYDTANGPLAAPTNLRITAN
jgi:parallel beta-helix repeat protein